jgi:hypothetical protein
MHVDITTYENMVKPSCELLYMYRLYDWFVGIMVSVAVTTIELMYQHLFCCKFFCRLSEKGHPIQTSVVMNRNFGCGT